LGVRLSSTQIDAAAHPISLLTLSLSAASILNSFGGTIHRFEWAGWGVIASQPPWWAMAPR